MHAQLSLPLSGKMGPGPVAGPNGRESGPVRKSKVDTWQKVIDKRMYIFFKFTLNLNFHQFKVVHCFKMVQWFKVHYHLSSPMGLGWRDKRKQAKVESKHVSEDDEDARCLFVVTW